MKLFMSVSLLVLSLSAVAHAGPGASRMATYADELPCFSRTPVMQERFIPPQTTKRSFITQKATKSYKPEDQSPKFSYIELSQKVEFLDSEHEIFIPISPKKQFSKVSPPRIKKESDHPVDVDLKKSNFFR